LTDQPDAVGRQPLARRQAADLTRDHTLVIGRESGGLAEDGAEFLPVEARIESRLTFSDPEHPAIALSPVFKTPEEVGAGSPLFLDMVEDARVLYDPDGFLGRSFDHLRARLCQLRARRLWRGNAWYWEPKPDLKPGEVFAL
jgi:hypothetical protein